MRLHPFAVILAINTAHAAPAPAPPPAETVALCAVQEVAVWQNRVHIACSYQSQSGQPLNASNHPQFFALPINSPLAGAFVAVGSAAWQATVLSPASGSLHATGICVGGGPNGNTNPSQRPPFFLGCNGADENSSHIDGVIRMITQLNPAAGIVTIHYNPGDLSGSAFGCLNSNCRVATFIATGRAVAKGD